MYGSVPAYRTLKEGVSDGPDVTELNRNLIDLGFDPYGAIADEESFGEATAAAVKRWQKAEGLPETGEVELGRVVFAPGARRVTDVKVTLGQDPPGASDAHGDDPDDSPPPRPRGERARRRQIAGEKTREQIARQRQRLARQRQIRQRNPPKRNGQRRARQRKTSAKEEPRQRRPGKESPGGESGAGAGEVVLTTTSTQQIVQLKVKPEQQQLARLGETVTVQLPGGGEAPGHVTEVGTVASESKGSGRRRKRQPQRRKRRIDHDPRDDHPRPPRRPPRRGARQRRTRQGIRRNVLTVPATALIATAGGGYAVEALEDDRRVTVPVTPGMFAGGYVQVEGAGVHEGMTVIESQ